MKYFTQGKSSVFGESFNIWALKCLLKNLDNNPDLKVGAIILPRALARG